MKGLILAAAALLAITPAQASIEIEPNEHPPHRAYRAFSKVARVFGVEIYATDHVSDAKMLHAAHVLAEYLDNDEDGIADMPSVIEIMTEKRPAHLIMFASERAHERSGFDDRLPDRWFRTHTLQTLYADETFERPDKRGREFDPTLEETWHLVSSGGLHFAMPREFSEQRGSLLSRAMREAMQNKGYNPDANERGLPHIIKVSEYFYWLLTSVMDGQNQPGRYREIRREWKLNTPQKVKEHNPQGYELVTSKDFGLPTRLPDGNYDPGN